MTPIESFVISLLFIGGCGFLYGILSGHERLKRSRDVKLPNVSSTLQLLVLLCMPIADVMHCSGVRRLTSGTSL